MKIETIAVRIRKILLQKTHEQELDRINKIRKHILKANKAPKLLPASFFAYKFLEALDPLQDQFLEKKPSTPLAFPWQKHYQSFLDQSLKEAHSIKNIPQYLKQFETLIPKNIEHLLEIHDISDNNYTALKSLQWYQNERNFMPFLINCQLLKSLEEQNITIKWSTKKNLWQSTRQFGQTTYQINHSLAPIEQTLLLNIVHSIKEKTKRQSKSNSYLVKYYDDGQHRAFQAFIQRKVNNTNTRGIFQDSGAIVNQVRGDYFEKMDKEIQVEWSNSFNVRKLAHYNFKEDMIVFSLIFDLPNVDQAMLMFLAYHEILHRFIGLETSKKTIQAHTPRFKKMEQSFPNYTKLDYKLNQYALGKI